MATTTATAAASAACAAASCLYSCRIAASSTTTATPIPAAAAVGGGGGGGGGGGAFLRTCWRSYLLHTSAEGHCRGFVAGAMLALVMLELMVDLTFRPLCWFFLEHLREMVKTRSSNCVVQVARRCRHLAKCVPQRRL